MRIIPVIMILTLFALAPAHAAAAEYQYGQGRAVTAAPDPATVRAEMIQDAGQLPGGPLAQGRIGDFKLSNNRVAFVIAGTRPGSGSNPFGGVIQDAALLRQEAGGHLAWYNVMGPGGVFPIFFEGSDPILGARLFAPVSAEILKDGSDGEAVVRITGRDALFPTLAEIFGRSPGAIKILVTIDYVLRPDSPVLEIRTSLENKSKNAKAVAVGAGMLIGDGARLFAPGPGFHEGGWPKHGPYPLLAAAGPSVSYGWFLDQGEITVHQVISHHAMTSFGTMKMKPDGTGTLTQFMTVAQGDVASVYAEYYKAKQIHDNGTVSGSILDSAGAPVPDAEIHVLDADGAYVNQAHADSDGRFSLTLRPGQYTIQATSEFRNDPPAQTIELNAGQVQELKISFDDPAWLAFDVRDGDGRSIPATVALKSVETMPSAARHAAFYRFKPAGGGFDTLFFSVTGKDKIPVKPGVYNAYFSRGFEYEIAEKQLDLKSGESSEQSITLPRVVDTTGWVSSDFHIHAAPSHDSNDLIEWKVSGIAATGLEIPVATDHDRVTDYTPTILSLGLDREVKSIIGQEITTQRLGHINAFPLIYDPATRNQGALEWLGLTAPEIFQAARDNNSKPRVVQLNHARESALGYLSYIGYNPETGKASDAKNFNNNFDAMEILNSRGYDFIPRLMADWTSFLDRGHRVAGVGNSDSHNVYNLQVGYPRNFVQSKTDVPGDVLEDDFIQSIRNQRITVCGGPFITATLAGAGSGDTATAKSGGTLEITIQAPSWVTFDTVTVLEGGKEIASFPVQGNQTPVRFKQSLDVKPAKDTWYIVVAQGSKDLFPVYPGAHAYSFTNPIYVDVDGNGAYDAPLASE